VLSPVVAGQLLSFAPSGVVPRQMLLLQDKMTFSFCQENYRIFFDGIVVTNANTRRYNSYFFY
jgi:hypothetical protein